MSKPTPRKFAENTTVEASKTRGEIETLLNREGATGYMYAEKADKAFIQFELRERLIRFKLAIPDKTKFAAEYRRRWRALLLVLKGKLESIRDNTVETFEEAFLAHTVTPDGRTAAEIMLPQLAEARRTGKQPEFVLALPPSSTQGGR